MLFGTLVSEVLIITNGMLWENLLGTAVKDISEWINVGFDLMAANRTKIPFIGRADVRMQLLSSTEEKQKVHSVPDYT